MARGDRKRKKRGEYSIDAGGVPDDLGLGEVIQISADDADNPYAHTVDEGHKVDPRAQKIFVMAIVLVIVFLLGLVLPKGIYTEMWLSRAYGNGFGYTLATLIADIQYNVTGIVSVFTAAELPGVDYSDVFIRYIIIAITGAGLALCGAVYQGAFKNALVSPSTLGVMTGGNVGLTLWVALAVTDTGRYIVPGYGAVDASTAAAADGVFPSLWVSYSMVLFSFLGCFIVVGLVLLTVRAAGGKGTSSFTIIIIGQIVSSVAQAVASAIRYWYMAQNPYSVKSTLLTDLEVASFWRTYSWIDVVALIVPVVIVFLVMLRVSGKMQLLAFDAAESRSMGVDSRRTQYLVVGLCTLLTAILISFCGRVGFVGFLIPHLARRMMGPDFKYLLPGTMMLGALFVLGAYVLVVTVFGSSYETVVGTFITIFGAIVFIVTALRGKGTKNGQFL